MSASGTMTRGSAFAAKWFVTCAFASTACHPTDALEPPDLLEGMRSVVVMIESGEGGRSVFLQDVGPDQPFQPPVFSAVGDTNLAVMGFRCSLETLGLSPGPARLDSNPSTRSLLPPPDRVLTSAVASGTQSDWAEDELSESADLLLRALDLPENNLCRLYTIGYSDVVRLGMVPTTTSALAAFMIAADDRTALFGSDEGQVVEVSASGGLRERDDLARGFEHSYVAAHRLADGQIWLVDEDLGIAHGNIDSFDRLDVTTSTPGLVGRIGLTGSESASSFELFAVSDQGTVDRFAGDDWAELYRGPPREVTRLDGASPFMPQAIWLGPGRIIAIGPPKSPDRVMHIDQSSVSQEILPADVGIAQSVGLAGDFGPLLGTSQGAVLQWVDDEWTEMPGARDLEITNLRGGFVPIDGGFLLIRTSELLSKFGQYHPISGFCPMDVELTNVVAFAPLDEAHIAVVEREAGGAARAFRFAILGRSNERPDCLPD